MTRKQKGVTLVPLIVLIVVLIILASVAIVSLKDEKVIDRAENFTNEFDELHKTENSLLNNYIGNLKNELE